MWRDVKEYEGIYVINEAGDVKRVDTEKILSPAVSTAGYPVVSLWKENKGTLKTIHRLLAECFIYNDDPLQKKRLITLMVTKPTIDWRILSGLAIRKTISMRMIPD